MKVLITGGNGQVAYDLIRLAQQKKMTIMAPARDALDITQPQAVTQFFQQHQPDVVINTAAYTRVDQAETEKEQAYAVNQEGAKNLAIACADRQLPLLHVSTDYVFDGKTTRPYREEDVVSPISIYGDSKWQGEEEVRRYCDKHVIVRVSSVFGVHGMNFVKTILRLAQEKETLRIIADKISCPTPASAIAAALLKIAEKPQWGTYHFCGSAAVTWHDFSAKIIQHAQPFFKMRVRQVDAIPSKEYPTPAQRPAYSVLNCEKIKTVFGIDSPDWEKELKNVITTLSAA